MERMEYMEQKRHGPCAYLVAGQVAEDVVGGDAHSDLVDGKEGRVRVRVALPVRLYQINVQLAEVLPPGYKLVQMF